MCRDPVNSGAAERTTQIWATYESTQIIFQYVGRWEL